MQLAISVLIIAATALVVYSIIRSNPAHKVALPPRPSAPYTPVLPDAPAVHHWSDGGRFLVEVVNESRYQPVLAALAGTDGDAAARAPYTAMLFCDDRNAYEDAAVAVFLEGQMAGYLGAKEALNFRARLKRDGYAGQLTSCAAQVRGGGLWQNARLAYHVVLDLEPLDKR
ncbi:hypothetical protein ASF61_02495 [Duganella sp. Leaf126]|uniref:hypothetical protein n=1 Tax=Duganella sp. Leaf126 TaxID=1736266 RepID=UPI000701401A|nr:hypothetical protein [Duganella sp. Leaf126]KQQ47522.1 hypothetical protein ASF61_02495 [Duganella sp. Leaf126]